MFYERRKNPFAPGGTSVHHLWPLEVHLRWTSDWELRYGPPTAELTVLLAIIMGMIVYALP